MSAAPVRAPVRTLAVVVPAHDEAELLPACLDALAVSLAAARRARPDLVVAAVVVLDACRDASADVVARRTVPGGGLVGLAVAEANVGRARRAGVAHALERLGGADPARTWIASTDADSVVPPGWATHHLDLADDGADVVLGGVRPPLADLTPGRARAWLARHVPGVANGHVHGANLGVRADVYAAAGGYAPLVEHEDVGLVATARELGARVVATADAWVLTSARLVGRTPGGYARYLRDDLENVGGLTAVPVRVAAPLVASDALRAAAALSVALVAARADLVAVALFLLVLGGTMVPRALGVSGALDASFCGTVLLGAWAAELDWYRAVSWLDVVVHAAITGLVAVLAYAALVRWRLVQPGPGAVVVTVGLGAALSTLWEIGEWAGHTFLDGRIAVGYQDTVGDLAAGLTGALVAGLLLARGRLLAGSRS